MLVVNENLSPKKIRGKKYRSPAFTMSAIFSIPFIVTAIVASASVPPREGRVAIIGLLFIVWMALPVALLLGFRKTSYIMGADKLYFFNSLVNGHANGKRKKLRHVRTNGSIDYSDIKDFRYFGIDLEGRLLRDTVIVPPRVVIIGDDFEVEIYAYKSLINKIKKLI